MKKIYFIITVVIWATSLTADAQYCTPSYGRCWGVLNSFSTNGLGQNVDIKNIPWGNGVNSYNDHSALDTVYLDTTGPKAFTAVITTCRSRMRIGRMEIWIDWNGNLIFDQNERVFINTGTSRTSPYTVNGLIPLPATLPAAPVTRMRITTTQSSPCYRGTRDGSALDLIVVYPIPHSASPGQVLSPSTPLCASNVTELSATVKNTGQKVMDSVTIGARIHYGIHPNRSIQYIKDSTFYVNLASYSSSNAIKLGNFNNGFRANDSIFIWTSNPGGVPDDYTLDDTLLYVIKPTPIKKYYTIGDTVNQANDFPNIKDAVDFLNGFGAICDSITFAIEDTILWRGQYSLNDITGASAQTPIIFKPKPGQTQPVVIEFDSNTVRDNYVFRLNGAHHVIFEDLHFLNQDQVYQTGYSNLIALEDGAHDISFMRCQFEGVPLTSDRNRNRKRLVQTESEAGPNITFDHCSFINGSDAIYLEECDDLSITNCSFKDQYLLGIHVKICDNLEISRCNFRSNSAHRYTGNNFQSIGSAALLQEVRRKLVLSHNEIESSNGQWPRIGFMLDRYNALASTSEVYNNSINCGQPWSSLIYTGVYVNQSIGFEANYNTMVVTGNNQDNAALRIIGGTRNSFHNNICAAMLVGKAILSSTAAAIFQSDYNCLYVRSGNDVAGYMNGDYKSLADWQLRTTLDKNSLSVNPNFYSIIQNDLHVCNDSLFLAGTPIQGLSEDMDGDTREPNNPCIGADEFAPVSHFTLGSDYGLCPNDSTILQGGRGHFGELAIWKDAQTGTILDSGLYHTVHTPGLFEVTLLNACGIQIDTIHIISPEAVALGNDTNLCPDKSMLADALIENGTTYQWSNGESAPVISVSKPAVYIVTATDDWGCISVDSFELTYSSKANLNLKDAVICDGVAIQLYGGTPNGPDVTYKWGGFLGAGAEIADNVFVDYIQVDDNDTITLELTHRGCVTHDTCTVIRDTPPDANDVTWYTNGLAFVVKSNTTSGTTHLWKFDDGNTSTNPAPRHLYQNSGTYEVTYYSTNICGTDSAVHLVNVIYLGMEEDLENPTFKIYPNPSTNGFFTLDFNEVNAEKVHVTVFNLLGKTVADQSLGVIRGNLQQDFDLGNPEAGIYFVQVDMDGVVHTAKLTVD